MPKAATGDILDKYKQGIESYCAVELDDYTSHLKPSVAPRSSKEFNDPVWGTIVLHPLELVLLDSPLVQRLRRIRQLGVAHWVYPGANHTRFEHTLGTVHQLQRLINAINLREPDRPYVLPPQVRLLRVAALCHDIGHGMLSHVSEKALESFPEIEDLRLAFADKLKQERRPLSEIAAYYMTGSPAFGRLLKRAQEVTGEHVLPAGTVRSLRNAIIGRRISHESPLLHELIAGPFDVDKLDYMPRDAFMSGVPVVTDVNRLIQKVRAVNVSRGDLPPEIGRTVRGGHPSYTVVGIDRSGGRTLDELMLGRTLLYDKIYRHQKVRAVEAMFASIFAQIGRVISAEPALLPLLLTDDEMLSLDEDCIRRLAVKRLRPTHRRQVAVAVDLASRLRGRNLFVRSFAYGTAMPLDPYRDVAEQVTGLDRLFRESTDPQTRRSLVQQIDGEVRSILKQLNQTDLIETFGEPDFLPYIWLDPPRPAAEAGDISRAYLITGDGKLLRFKDDYAQTKGWTDAYLLTRDTGYVFAPRELSPYVYLACEKVVRERFEVRIPPSMLDYAKQEPARIERIRRKLSDAGHYSAASYDLRPEPKRLTRADIDDRLDSIVGNLRGYNGPLVQPDKAGAGRMDAIRVRGWLRQFETDSLVDAALTMLENCRLIGREEVVQALEHFMEAHGEFRGGYLCSLGTPKDSSAITTCYAGDVAQNYDLKIADTLHSALEAGAPIVFVDDFISSGHQAASIVEAWLGADQTVNLGEDRGSPLTDSLQNMLRQRRLGFVFSAGSASGREYFEQRLAELNLQATVHVGIPEAELPRAFGAGLFESSGQERLFRASCTSIGVELLTGDGKHDTAWATERSLGYGNNAYLIIFPYNTPSQTLTCLWAAGTVNGVHWEPLFPRRKKT